MMFGWTVDDEIELRLYTMADVQELYRLTNANRQHLRQWLPWVDDVESENNTVDFVKRSRNQFAEERGFQLGIWCRGELAGTIGLHDVNRHHRQTSLGYWLGAEYQGMGIMTRACQAVVDYVVDELGMHRVEIRCAVENKKSRAIPERLGFRQEGVLEDAEWLYDRFVSLVVYGKIGVLC